MLGKSYTVIKNAKIGYQTASHDLESNEFLFPLVHIIPGSAAWDRNKGDVNKERVSLFPHDGWKI